MILTVQVFLFWPHYFMRRRLTHSFGYRGPGDAVLGSGYPVGNALSRHPVLNQMYSGRSRKGPKSSKTAWVSWPVSVGLQWLGAT